MCALYKRKIITKTVKLKRIKRYTGSPFCDSDICQMMKDGNRWDGCIFLCYRFSDFDSSYYNYERHMLRYIGM